MATLALELPAATNRRSTLAIFAKETKYEFLKLLRTRTFSLSMIGFPLMFYALFGLSNKGSVMDGMDVAKYMLAGYCCFGLVGASLFGIGVGLAAERSQGWLELKRASPMPPMAYLLAKCITAQAFGVIIVVILSTMGVLFGGVHLSAREVVLMLGVTLAGTIPFAAMGLLLALTVSANAASGVVNLIYLPLSFMSGLWIPLKHLPAALQAVAPYLPAYHLSQLMLTVFHFQQPGSSVATHWMGLAGFTLLMLGASWAVFHRAEQDA
jgi:ABC-2 type transport system permease protein